MKYAVFTTGGKQYKVQEGDTLNVERLVAQPNDLFSFENVLLFVDGETTTVGVPFIDGAQVNATIVDHLRGEKIRVAKFKAKARYRRVTGHRQALTQVKIAEIVVPGSKKTTPAVKKEETVAGEAVKTAKVKVAQTKKSAKVKISQE